MESVQTPLIRDIFEGLEVIQQETGLHMNQLVILWLLSKTYVSTAILGGDCCEHYRSTWDIADRNLPQDVVQRIDELSAQRVYMPIGNQQSKEGPALYRWTLCMHRPVARLSITGTIRRHV